MYSSYFTFASRYASRRRVGGAPSLSPLRCRVLWDFRVEYPGTWLQRLTPADVSTAELARRCSCGVDTLIDDVECALAANENL